MVGSGYRTPPALVRRGDGQTLQLTPLLYRVLEAVDGRRSCVEIAAVVREGMRRGGTAGKVATLANQHLRPLGLLMLADGSEPPVKRSNPLLALRFKFAVTDPQATRRLTDPFRVLFRPAVVTLVVLAFLAITWWVFFRQGLAPATYDAFQRPQLLLLVFGVTVLSAGFHEFGHAAAARYCVWDPGVIGAGLYLAWPAFYTDVTDSYRLGRAGRIRTDLGGLYFNAVVVVLTFVSWSVTGWDALLLVVATQTLQMMQQLMPLLRFDGYHLLADLTGVPDLYHRMRPILLGLLPHRWSHPDNKVLKPWARLVITAWVLVTIPMLAFMLLAMVTSLPRVLGTAWAAVQVDGAAMGDAWHTQAFVGVTAHALQVVAVVLPVLAGLLIVGRISRRWIRRLLDWSRGSVPRQLAAVGLVAFAVTALSWAWMPRPGTYRPITPGERGLLTAVLSGPQDTDDRASTQRAPARPPELAAAGAYAERRLAAGTPLQATFPAGRPLPTRSHPRLAMVLVPTGKEGRTPPGPAGPTESTDPTHASDPTQAADPSEPADPSETADPPASDGTWVFPFDKPLPPDEGDNQAAAFNTTDGSVKYDVAFALVWATGDEIYNVNEAHAYASCSNCVTVAVAFQVVLIMDNAHVVVPQNLSVAANYDCYQCITAAIASQLVLSVEKTPGQQQLLALGDVWSRVTELGKSITTYSIAEISDKLQGFKSEIAAILDATPPVPATTPTPSSAGPPTNGTDPSSSTRPSSAATQSDAPTSAPSDSAQPQTSNPPSDPPSNPPPSDPPSDPATSDPPSDPPPSDPPSDPPSGPPSDPPSDPPSVPPSDPPSDPP